MVLSSQVVCEIDKRFRVLTTTAPGIRRAADLLSTSKTPRDHSRSHSQAHPEPNRLIPRHPAPPFSTGKRHHFQPGLTLIHGEDRDAVLSPNWKPLQQLNDIQPLHPLIQEIAQGSFRQKQPPAIQGSGWVVKSLEASLWAFHDAETFEEAVLRAVNLNASSQKRKHGFMR